MSNVDALEKPIFERFSGAVFWLKHFRVDLNSDGYFCCGERELFRCRPETAGVSKALSPFLLCISVMRQLLDVMLLTEQLPLRIDFGSAS